MKKALKRSLSLLLAITIIFGSACIGVSEGDFSPIAKAYSVPEGLFDIIYTLNDDGRSYSVTGYVHYRNGSLTIPSTYKGKPVTTIGANAFSNCYGLESITLPDSIVSVEYDAFFCCKSLRSVEFGNGLKSIDDYAFNSCWILESITLPDSVKSIGDYAFKDCNCLESVVLGSGIRSIGSGAFTSTKITSIVIPDGVECINYRTFSGCNKLSSVKLPSTLKMIYDAAFAHCVVLDSIEIPDSVTSIAEDAFFGCTGLDGIYINDIASWCKIKFPSPQHPNPCPNPLYYANDLYIKGELATNVVIPDGVTNIGDYVFSECKSITSITIPKSVKTIGRGAFSGCTNLKDVYYVGSQEEQNIDIESNNFGLTGATWHYAKVSKPATPKVATTNEIGGVNVTWNKVAGATKYVVYRRQGGYNTWVNVGTTTGNTLLDKNVKSGIYYVYSVRAYNAAGKYSDFVSANTQTRKFMATPKLTTIYNHQNGLAIKWNAVAGVTKGYRVYRRGAGSTYWTYLGTTKNLYFIDSQVKNKSGEYFRYTVIADGDYHSKFDTTGLYLRRLANPTLNSAVSSKSGITVKWGAVKGTTGYYVYRKTANSTWTRVGTVGGTNNTTFLDKTAKKGVTYTYTVKAVYGATTSAYNTGISCKDKY